VNIEEVAVALTATPLDPPGHREEEEMAVVLTPILSGLPYHRTEERVAPLGAPLQLVLTAGGEPRLSSGPAALRHLLP
jgi:hypothetical protein